jgi:hypothetical protein
MAYQQNSGIHRLNEFVPTYVPHSDYLPNRVVDVHQPEAQQWVYILLSQLANYEEQKRLGQVHTQKPASFNPNRYISVRTYENVALNKPISEVEFNSRVRKV